MDERRRCDACRSALPPGAPGGRCPKCLLELGLGFTDATVGEWSGETDEAADPSTIARYRIIRRIGEGGMGIVYEAEQEHPRRTVALKIIRPGQTSADVLRRFELETEALGRLQHPGIAQIYEAGTADIGFGPQPFFAMEIVRGVSPKEYAEMHDLDPRQRMEIVARIADAVQHAHQRGLIHRDLKPGNILVDANGQPKILDFGVARFIDDPYVTLQTGVGQLVGTLAYMSPEQVLADPNELDTRTDVYSMGVILYEVLTGRLPYKVGTKIHEVIQAIREEDPGRLSTVSRVYRGDIETIAAKALEKNKARRYASAGEMAADIRRYLNDEPIVARPPSASYQLQKFARRHKGLVAAAAAIALVLVGGVLVSTFLAVRAGRERDRAAAAERQADAERDRALGAERQARTAEDQARRERDAAFTERQRADGEAARSRSLRLAQAWQWLARESLEASRHRYDDDLAALLARQSMLFHARIPGPQPRYLVEEALQQSAQHSLWNPILRRRGGMALAFSSDGRRIVSEEGPSVRVWDVDSPDTPLMTLRSSEDITYTTMALSRDGTRLAAGDLISVVRVWDLRQPDAAPMVFKEDYYGPVRAIALSQDGSRVATAAEDDTYRLWDVKAPEAPPLLLRGSTRSRVGTDGWRFSRTIAFSADGGRLAVGGLDDTVRVWNVRDSGTPPVTLRGNQGRPFVVVFSEDGNLLMCASDDRTVRRWDLRNPDASPTVVLEAPGREFKSAAFSQNLERVAIATDDAVRIWDLRNSRGTPLLVEGPLPVNVLEFSADGWRLVSASNAIRMLDLRDSVRQPTPQQLRLQGTESVISSVNWPTFSADLKYLALAVDKTVRLWETARVDNAPTRFDMGEFVTSLAFSPDSALIAAGSADKTVRIASVAKSFVTRTLPRAHDGAVIAVAFSQDATRLASLSLLDRLEVLIWTLNGKTESPSRLDLPLPREFPRRCQLSLRIAPSLTHVACGGTDGRVILWNLRAPKGSPPLVLRASGSVGSLSFSPDGRWLATTSGNLRVWDVQNPLAPPKLFAGSGRGLGEGLAFSSDSAHVAVGDLDRAMLFEMQNPDFPPRVIRTPSSIGVVGLAPDGNRLAVFGGLDGRVEIVNMWTRTADYLCARVRRNLTTAEWRHYVGPDIPYERTCASLLTGADTRSASAKLR